MSRVRTDEEAGESESVAGCDTLFTLHYTTYTYYRHIYICLPRQPPARAAYYYPPPSQSPEIS